MPKREKQEPSRVFEVKKVICSKPSSYTWRSAPGLRRGAPGRREAQELRNYKETSTSAMHLLVGAAHLSFKLEIHSNHLLQVPNHANLISQVSLTFLSAIARVLVSFHSVSIGEK